MTERTDCLDNTVADGLRRELRRCRTITRLLREAHRLRNEDLPITQVPRRILHTLTSSFGLHQALLFRQSVDGSLDPVEAFAVAEVDAGASAALDDLGRFAIVNACDPRGRAAREVLGAEEATELLWLLDERCRMALLLGMAESPEGTGGFSEPDRQVAEEAIGLVAEVVERRLKLRTLRESEERFRGFVENMGDAAFRADREGRVTFVNRVAVTMTGVAEEEIIGRSFLNLFAPESIDEAAAVHRKLIAGEGTTREVVFANGVVAQVVAEPLRDSDGQVVGVFGTCRDVTDARNQEETLHNLIECSLQGLVIIQGEQVVFCNRVAAESAGISSQKLTSMSVSEVLDELIHPDDRELVRRRLRARLDGGEPPYNYSIRVLRGDGAVVRFRVDARRTVFNGRPAVQAAILELDGES